MALTAIQVKEAKSHGKDLKISDGGGHVFIGEGECE